MEILILSDDNSLISVVKQTICLKDNNLNVASKENLRDVIINKTLHGIKYMFFDDRFDLVILDEEVLDELKEKNMIPSSDDQIYHAMILIAKDSQNIDFKTIKLLGVTSLVPYNMVKEMLVSTITLLSRRHEVSSKVLQMVHFDPLMEIYNRRSFMMAMEHYLNLFQKEEMEVCVSVIDLDDFKFMNDTFGHNIGDKVLKFIAQAIFKNIRNTDLLGRIGGEEYGVIFPNTNLNQARHILSRIRQEILTTTDIEEHLKVTFSAGIVMMQKQHSSILDVLQTADLLLYKAKDLGRDQICY